MPNGDTVQGPELKGGWVEDFESSEDDVRGESALRVTIW